MKPEQFSYFDNVVFPVIVLSPDLKFIYANRMALLQFGLLSSSDGLSFYFSPEQLEAAAQSLLTGQSVSLCSKDGVCGSMLFEPVFSSEGKLHHVLLYVKSFSDAYDGVFPLLSEGEIFRLIHKEVLCPVQDLLRSLCMVEHLSGTLSDPVLSMSLMSMRKRLLRMSLFTAQTEDFSPQISQSLSLCDINALLLRCVAGFPPLQYDQSAIPCFVPADRDFVLRLILDVLTAIYLRQKPNSHIFTSVIPEEHQVRVVFRSVSLLTALDKPCGEDLKGFDVGFLSVSRRVARVGGNLLVEKLPRNAARVTLTFPSARMKRTEVVLGQSSPTLPTFFETCVIEYLQALFNDRSSEQ